MVTPADNTAANPLSNVQAGRDANEPLACNAALTHHWLIRERGGEKVLRAFRDLLPDAPIHTLVYDRAELDPGWDPVHAPWLGRTAFARKYYPKLLPILPMLACSIRLPPVDLVLCSDAAIAKAMRVHDRTKLICYCHSPMRYVWDLADEYRATLPAPLRPLWGPLCRYVRRADVAAAKRVDLFVANSRHVADRIRRNYGCEAAVVYPPVEVPDAPSTQAREDFYLAIGYHVSYKRLDLAIAACRELNRKLVVIGAGPDVDAIDRAANPHVELRGWCRAEQIVDALAKARALLFPGEEDFGIVPVEAIGHGCPVIAYNVGGATETVVHEQTGLLFDEQTVENLVASMRKCEAGTFDARAMNKYAQRFSKARFLNEMREVCVATLESRKPDLDR